MSGHMYSFQCARKVYRDIVYRAGFDSGMMIFKKIFILLAPSIIAASSSSFGIPMKNCLNRKMPKAELMNGTIRALY